MPTFDLSQRVTDETGKQWDVSGTLTVAAVVVPDPAVPTTTLLTASEYEIVEGETVTLSAAVSPAEAAGSVSFFDVDADVLLGSAALVEGVATFTVSAAALAVGAQKFDAAFNSSDTDAYLDSESAEVVVNVTAVPAPVASTVVVTATPAAPVVGGSVTLNAALTPPVAGVVVFKSGAYNIGTKVVAAGAGTAQLVKSDFPAGTHTISATWTPTDTTITPSTSAVVPVTVAAAPTPPATNVAVPVKVKLPSGTMLSINAVDSTSIAFPGGRGANELHAYTRTGGKTATQTNYFGCELAISDSVITVKNDRQPTANTTGTPIPADGYVLSGHGTARDALLTFNIGATVELYDAAGARTYWQATGATEPTPDPATPPPATTGKVMSYWHLGYRGPTWAEIPADIKSKVTDWSVAMATSAGGGTGNIQWSPTNETAATFKAGVTELRAAGKNVILGIGGSAGGGITVNSTATQGQFVSSIKSLCSTYGFNGIDTDLEPASSAWTTDYVAAAARQLIADLPGFKVVITPGLYSTYTAKWMDLAQKIGHDKYHYCAPMLYDFPEAGDSRLSGVAVQKCDVMRAAGVPENKMVLGYMPRPNAGYANSTPDVAIMNAATAAVKAKYPTVRGVFLWEDAIDREQGSAGMPGPAWKYGRGIVLP